MVPDPFSLSTKYRFFQVIYRWAMLNSNQRPPPCKGDKGRCRGLHKLANPAYLGRFSLPRLAPCCIVLRSRWCQSGVHGCRIFRPCWPCPSTSATRLLSHCCASSPPEGADLASRVPRFRLIEKPLRYDGIGASCSVAMAKSKAPHHPNTAQKASDVVVPRLDQVLVYSRCAPPPPGPPRAAEGSNGTLQSVGYVLLKTEVLERPTDATGRLV